MFLYVVFERAIAAQELMPVEDREDGSPPQRGDGDPFRHIWYASARKSRTSRARNSRNGTTL
jgi:hypothetical protein